MIDVGNKNNFKMIVEKNKLNILLLIKVGRIKVN